MNAQQGIANAIENQQAPTGQCTAKASKTCLSDPDFAKGNRTRYTNKLIERSLGDFAQVTNVQGKMFTQDIWDHGSPGEFSRIDADQNNMYFKIPKGLSGSNGNQAATGATFHLEMAPTTHATMSYKVFLTARALTGVRTFKRTAVRCRPTT